MCRLLALLALAFAPVAHAAPPPGTPPAPAAAPASASDLAFTVLAARWLADWLRLNPVAATQLGEHAHDGRWPDLTPAGRAARRRLAADTLAALARIDRARLSRQNQIDHILLSDRLRAELFAHDTLADWATDPMGYSQTVGGGLYALMAREFAPLPSRLASATQRLEGLPTVLAQVRAALDPARVPPTHARTAAAQNRGVAALIDGVILGQKAALDRAGQARLDAAAQRAKTALSEHQAWLDGTLVPQARGEARLGAERYDRLLALTLGSPLSRPEIKARAEATLADTRARMYAIARTMLAGRPGAPPLPEAPTPAQQQAAIAAALEISYADTVAPDQVVPFARETLVQAFEHARRADFISFPETDFEIIEMPEFARGFAVAYADSPGPLDRGLKAYYAVSPIPADWTPEQTRSFLREYNKWAIHELTIHEAVPGHLLQLAHSNRFPGVLRAVLASGSMIEGWAMYSEDLMAESGHLGGDPRYLLAWLKLRLRATTNALLDIGYHTGGLTREEAMRMMMEGAFQEEREAAGKWTRMELSAAQLPTYFVGWLEWRDLRAEMERRPGFSLKAFHDAALAHGSPPVRMIRALLLDAPVE
jgi:uncharacterized protein (DUF885 family)